MVGLVISYPHNLQNTLEKRSISNYHFAEGSAVGMRKAYDTFLQSEVSADLPAKSGSLEPYRFECAHCGEEVRLAAVGSISMVPHFRHRSGNNDVECENYLGQYGAISTDSHSRKSKNERAEFYFDKSTKMFCMGLCFSDNEITVHEQNITAFELRASAQEQAFYTLQINHKNFSPNDPRMIPIMRFSNNYFLSNTLNGIKRKHEIFKSISTNAPTFFKIQGNDENYKAKLVRSKVLYTNVQYFAAYQSQYTVPYDSSLPNEIRVDETFQFKTMGRNFLGKNLVFKNKTAHIDSLVMSWGYQLEASETMTLLWPPAVQVDDVSVIESDTVFLFSSFALQAHGNINVHSEDIEKVSCNISKVSVKAQTKVYKNNVEIIIAKDKQHSIGFDDLQIVERYESAYDVSNDSTHYLFSRSGVAPAGKGQSISLFPGCVIRRYMFGYLDACIYPRKHDEMTGEQLLNDLVSHYKRTETFTANVFDLCDLSEIAFQYLGKCELSGLINSAAKQFIMEGRL